LNKAFSGGRREESFILDYLGAVNHFYFTETIQPVSDPYDINVISVQMWYNPTRYYDTTIESGGIV